VYSVKVYRENKDVNEDDTELILFKTNMTFVSIDHEGNKQMMV